MPDSSQSPWKLPGDLEEKVEARFPQRKLPEPEHSPEPQPPLNAQEVEWKDLVNTLRRHRRRLLSFPGVTAVDIGYWLDDHHEFSNELALRVHVERKLHPSCFKKRPYDRLPQTIESPMKRPIRVNVIEAKYRLVSSMGLPRPRSVFQTPVSLNEVNRRRRLDPLVGGISIGSPQAPIGTLGALVWDNTDGSICILSNWHVLAGDFNAEVGNPCFQPGRFDHGRSSDVVARLKRWSLNRQTDAAIAELTGSRHYCAGEIVSLFQQISGVQEPHLGMKLLKSGRSTGYSWGFIDGLYFSAAIQYSNGSVRVFEEQIHIAPLNQDRPISEPGDSGSVWVTETNGEGYRAVGLHFAGDLPDSAFGEFALANPMTVVAERLNFSFRPVFLEIRDEDVVLLPGTPGIQIGNGKGKGVGQPVIFSGEFDGTGGQQGDPIPIPPGGRILHPA